MKRSMMFGLGVTAALASGLIILEQTYAFARPGQIIEERVDANLVRVRINGEWQEFPLTPLAQTNCDIQDDLYLRYCP
jgi:hypothetical protein